MVFESAKWIWLASGEHPDQYAEFIDTVSGSAEKTVINLSCDGDYALFINGGFVASNQYGDFEHYKIYDTIDITKYLTESENHVRFLIYHCGLETFRYCPAKAGLIYEIIRGQEIISDSREDILSGESAAYSQNMQKWINMEIGLTFFYDATREGETLFSRSVVVDKQCTLFPRPNEKLEVYERHPVKSLTELSPTNWLIDLGEEVLGLPTLDLVSETEQILNVSYGEHLVDGHVPRIIGDRDFSFEYRARIGDNRFTDYMLRFGCRYIEICSEHPIKINYVGVLPQRYPLAIKEVKLDSELDRQIYDMCLKTLRLCIMEHYVDCPWREQSLYGCDSRNQMLIGYYAFSDGNFRYARSNLKLMAEDRRDDGLLTICAPTALELTIPSFALYYIIAVDEYISYSKDTSLGKETYDKILGILRAHERNMDDGLVLKFSGKHMWNFYDWTIYSNGEQPAADGPIPDLAINALYILALEAFERICEACSLPFPFTEEFISDIKLHARKKFLTENGLFTMTAGKDEYTTLCNVLAILADIPTRSEAEYISDRIVTGELIDCTLSMKLVEYSALLSVNTEKYRDFVLGEIRRNYSHMLSEGSDTAWETIKGAADFDNAGSLCHGWSAVPIYVYNKLGLIK